MTTEQEERIIRYLRGRMSESEVSSFLKDCKNDKNLTDNTAITAFVIKVLKSMESYLKRCPDFLGCPVYNYCKTIHKENG